MSSIINQIEVTSVINTLSEYGAKSNVRLGKEGTSLNQKELTISEIIVKLFMQLFGKSYSCNNFDKASLDLVITHVITHLTDDALTQRISKSRNASEYRDLINTSKGLTKLKRKMKNLPDTQKAQLDQIIAKLNELTTTYFDESESTPEVIVSAPLPSPVSQPTSPESKPTDTRVTLDPEELRTLKIKIALQEHFSQPLHNEIKIQRVDVERGIIKVWGITNGKEHGPFSLIYQATT